MKNHKQLLADFYLELLKTDGHNGLKTTILIALCDELKEDIDVVQRIFKRMAANEI